LVDAHLANLGFTLNSPRDPRRRGSHIALRHNDGWRITRAMIEQARVIPDFRDPDNIRFGLVPLYTSFTELETAVDRIRDLVAGGAHLGYDHNRPVVT
jgi:kynureninase